jgi:hypothetical protein
MYSWFVHFWSRDWWSLYLDRDLLLALAAFVAALFAFCFALTTLSAAAAL